MIILIYLFLMAS